MTLMLLAQGPGFENHWSTRLCYIWMVHYSVNFIWKWSRTSFLSAISFVLLFSTLKFMVLSFTYLYCSIIPFFPNATLFPQSLWQQPDWVWLFPAFFVVVVVSWFQILWPLAKLNFKILEGKSKLCYLFLLSTLLSYLLLIH